MAAAAGTHSTATTWIELEDALGRDDGLVVISSPEVASTAAVVERAMHHMLGDHTLIVVTRPHTADLVRILRRARGLAPVVVHVPDAPPALLARLTPQARALVDAQVRLVVTTRPAFLDAVHDDGVVAVVEPVTLRRPAADAGTEAADGVDDRSARVPVEGRALAQAVADVERFGLLPTIATAAALLPLYGVRAGTVLTARQMRQAWWEIGRAALTPGEGLTWLRSVGDWLLGVLGAGVGAVGATSRHLRLRRAVARAVRAGLVQRTRGGLRPTPAWLDHVGRGDPPNAFPRWLRALVSEEEALTAGLVALARGDVWRAALFLADVDRALVPSPAAMALARNAEKQGEDREAIGWYSVVGSRAEDVLAGPARRAAGLVGLRVGRSVGTTAWLEEAGEDESDLEVQDALARLALTGRRPAEARLRFERVAAGGGAAAPDAVYELALLASDEGRDADAEPLLRRAADDPDRHHAVRARLLLIRMLRRRGRRIEATVAAEEALAWLTDGDPESWVVAVSRELAALRDDGGDLDGAVVVLRRVAGRSNALALAAASDLAAAEARRGHWEAAVDAFPPEVSSVSRPSAPDPVLDVAQLAVVLATGLAVLAEAAYRTGRLELAVQAVRELIAQALPTASQALLIGKIAHAVGDVRGAHTYLTKAVEAGDAGVATEAKQLLEQVEPAVARLEAQEAARLAAQQAARAAALAAMPHFA